MAFNQVLNQLENMGVRDILLPFLLVFTVVFAVMRKVKIFEEKKFDVIIALVIAAATIFPHALWGTQDSTDAMLSNGMIDVVEVINNSLPSVSVIVVAILMALIIIGILGKRVELADNSLSGFIAFLAFAVIIYIFGNAAGWWSRPGWLRILDDTNFVALVLVILVFAIIIWFITKEDQETPDDRRIFKQFGSLLKGGKE